MNIPNFNIPKCNIFIKKVEKLKKENELQVKMIDEEIKAKTKTNEEIALKNIILNVKNKKKGNK